MFYRKYHKWPVYIGILIVLFFVAACNLQPVSSIRVKASPSIYVPLGTRKVTEEQIFKEFEKELQKNATGKPDKDFKLYRYLPGGTAADSPLHYLLYYPLDSFDMDINKYFGGTPLDNSGGASGSDKVLSRTFDTNISIPKIDQAGNFSVDVADIDTKLLEIFNAAPSITPTITVPPMTGEYTLPSVTLTFPGFETITFGAGSSLKISAAPTSGTPYSIKTAQMTSRGQAIHGNIAGYNVTFPLDNRTIDKTVTLTLTLTVTSGGSGTISRSLHGTIERATGVNGDFTITPTGGTITMPLSDDFRKATVGEGSVAFAIRRPSSWSGIAIKQKTTIQQSGGGGLNITPGDFQPIETPVSLNGQSLNNASTLTYTPQLQITLTNAVYTRASNLDLVSRVVIKSFSFVTLKNQDHFTQNQQEGVPADMKEWVKTIDFNKVSANITLNNGLPSGNDITIKLSSDCFHIGEQEKIFPAGQTTRNTYDSTSSEPSGFNLDVATTSEFDMKTQVLLPLPHYDGGNETFTLSNIETGSTIQFSGAVALDLDWARITLKRKNNKEESFPKTGRMDLSALTAKLKDAGVHAEDMPVYLYAGNASGLLDGNTMSIKLTAKYRKSDGTDISKDMVNKNDLSFKALPNNTFPTASNVFTGPIPDAMLTIKKGDPDVTASFADIMSEYPKDLNLACTLNMNEITIHRAAYDGLGGKPAKVCIDLIIDVPLGFKVPADKELSLTKLFNINMPDDVLGRNGPNTDPISDTFKVLDAVRSIKVGFNFKNGLNRPSDFVLRFKDGSGTALVEKPVTASGIQTLTFTADEWKRLHNTYPVSPDFLLKLSNGSYSLKNNFELGTSMTVLTEMNIDQKVGGN